MKKLKEFIINNYGILLILLISIIFSTPFIKYYISGHDTNFHAASIFSIAKSFQNGNIFYPRILPLIANDFGYSTEIFYGPISHFITASLLCVINLFKTTSVWTSMKIIHFLSMFLSGLFMYLFVNKISKNKNIALLSSIVYITFPYKLCEIFIRDAYAESLGFIFLPLIFWGLYELLEENNVKSFYKLFIVGVSGIILTHNITAIFTCIVILLYLLINIKKVLKKDIIKAFMISGLFILGITGIYVFPVIEEKLFGNVNIFYNGHSSASWVNTYALKLTQLLPIIGDRSFDGIQFNILLIPLIMMIISSILIIKNHKHAKVYSKYLFIGLLVTLCSTTIFPWEKVGGIFLYIQFPWRLLVFSTFFLSIISGYCIKLLDKNNKRQVLITVILCFLIAGTSGLFLNKDRLLKNEEIYSTNLQEVGLGAINDYLPVNTVKNIEYFNNRTQDILVIKGNPEITNVYKNTPYIEFEVIQDSNENSTLEIPLLYYKGYEVISTLENKNDIKMYENNNGFIELKVKGSQKVVINYVGTITMKLSFYLSLITIIIFIIFCYKGVEKDVKKN